MSKLLIHLMSLSSMVALGLGCKPKSEQMGVVFWESQITGACGHGSPLPLQVADAWRDYANSHDPTGIVHWVEKSQ